MGTIRQREENTRRPGQAKRERGPIAADVKCYAELRHQPGQQHASVVMGPCFCTASAGTTKQYHPIATPPPMVRFSTCVVFSMRSAAALSALATATCVVRARSAA